MSRRVTPQIAYLGSTGFAPDWSQLNNYFDTIGCLPENVDFLWDDELSGSEKITMFSGKVCYKSFKAGLNPNVTQVRDDPKLYIDNILKVAHGSVLEHATVNFLFFNVSRVFTHELVRHRVGVAFSQESLRFVRLTDLVGYLPKCMDDTWGRQWHEEKFEIMSQWQRELAEHYEIDNMREGFARKKELTSAFRRYAPIGLATHIVHSVNINQLRHEIQARTFVGAEEEIRIVFDQVTRCVADKFPLVFQDMERSEDGVWKSKYKSRPY